MRIQRLLLLITLAMVAVTAAWTMFAQTPAHTVPNPGPPPPEMLSAIPTALPSHNTPTPLLARPFFDWFSWESFIALNWPAAIDPKTQLPIRGVPNTSAGIDIKSPGTRVWETWKTDWETFRPNGAAPTEWSSWNVNPPSTPCSGGTAFTAFKPGMKIVPMATKMDSIVNAFNQAFSYPLIDQSRLYARYEIHLNQNEYTTVVNNKWYLAANIPPLLQFSSTPQSGGPGTPYGGIEIKAAWKELTSADNPRHYYTVEGLVLDPGPQPTCHNAKLGLIGFHIAHKLAPFREWVWSTFEQVDNVTAPPGGKPSFNNGTNTPQTTNGYDYHPKKQAANKPFPPLNDRKPVQVTRYTPIPTDGNFNTAGLNGQFQEFLRGSVWQYYELVHTQWPAIDNGKNFVVNGTYPAQCDTPFPVNHVANTVAETYFQNDPNWQQPGSLGDSCMQCHYGAGSTDFSWLLALYPYSPPVKGLAAKPLSPAAQKLLKRTAEVH